MALAGLMEFSLSSHLAGFAQISIYLYTYIPMYLNIPKYTYIPISLPVSQCSGGEDRAITGSKTDLDMFVDNLGCKNYYLKQQPKLYQTWESSGSYKLY